MEDDAPRLMLTAEEAESLLYDDREHVHNFMDAGPMLIGVDYERAHAIEAFKAAKQIEIAGAGARGMNHAIVVWPGDGERYSFFEADPEKVDAMEKVKLDVLNGSIAQG